MLRKSLLSLVAVLALTVVLVQSSTYAVPGGNDHRVRARMEGPTIASGKAVYRERQRNNSIEQRFDVEVEDAVPGDVMQIHVNDLMIGTIVINDLGIGEFQLRTAQFIDDPGDGDPIPSGFPTLVEGDVVTVGPLSGVFENH